MKLVKEILYEKFEEESDPIHDMGVGIKALINDYKKELIKRKEWDSNTPIANEDLIPELVSDIIGNYDYRTDSYVYPNKDTINRYFSILEYLCKGSNGKYFSPYLLQQTLTFATSASNANVDVGVKHRLIKFLIDNGIKIGSLDHVIPKKVSPEEMEIIKMVMKTGVDQRQPRYQQIFKNNLLWWSADVKNAEAMKYALELGAEPSYKDYFGLRIALEMRNKELVDFFIEEVKKDTSFK